MSRSAAYYLAGIPSPGSKGMLWFDFTVDASTPVSGTGVILFSHDGVGWSNLQEIQYHNGTASGRQTIDSTWAVSGGNYLKASFNQTLSNSQVLTVFVNYASTLAYSLLPYFVATVILLGAVLGWRRRW
jgi:hypothetical protein